VLVVSNLYPPHYVGGYELRCAQVAKHLQRAGHDTKVITSYARIPGADARHRDTDTNDSGPSVERWLRYHPLDPFPSRRLRTLALAREQLGEARRFRRLLRTWAPDVVAWWNVEGLSKAMLSLPAASRIPDAYFVDDGWLIREYGQQGEQASPGWFGFWRGVWGPAALRPMLGPATKAWASSVEREGIATRAAPLRPSHVCYVSEYMRQEHLRAGLEWPATSVIHGGVSPQQFRAERSVDEFAEGPLKLLYAGYVEPQRGLHTIVEAIGRLPGDLKRHVRLSIAQTDPPNPNQYVQDVKASIDRLGLNDKIEFIGKRPHDEMPQVYSSHHVLVSATTRVEGLPMTMMEALCAGCAVITTGSGGAIELAETADLPLFPKDDPGALSAMIGDLAANRQKAFEIAAHGQDVVLREFTLARMTERIEALLVSLS
jgi:glycosyltransferase involved in cell wall biosynthesis